MLKVHNAEYLRGYHAPFFSSATLCCAIAFLFTLLLPFFLGYATKQFWIKSNLSYEQPKVHYTGELFINLATDTTSLSYCSLSSIHQQFANHALFPIVETSNKDTNNDGLNDIIIISAILPVDPRKLTQVDMIIGLNYELTGVSKMRMASGVFVTFNTGAGASLIKAVGDLKFQQREPLPMANRQRTLYGFESIFAPLAKGSYVDALKAYVSRNETLEYRNNAIIVPYGDSHMTVEIKIKIPTHQEISYETELVEMLKSAWVQYLYLLIPIYFIIYEVIMWVIIKFRIVPTQPVDDELLTHSR